MDATKLREKLKGIGQENVLWFASELDADARQRLGQQLGSLDLAMIRDLADQYVRNKPQITIPKEIQPVKAYPRNPGADQKQLYADAERRGR